MTSYLFCSLVNKKSSTRILKVLSYIPAFWQVFATSRITFQIPNITTRMIL